jgi:CBS domain-containing membrane protein
MSRHPWTGFILPGATLRDRVWACGGALFGIGLTALVCTALSRQPPPAVFLVAPIGASAVLLFAVPASPLAQPWPIIGGNTLSALMGIAVSHLIRDPLAGAGFAVALAIGAMSLTRSLHPPGGAAALTAVFAGHAGAAADWSFAFYPVGLNCVLLVLCGWVFHRFTPHQYPHRHHAPSLPPGRPPAAAEGGDFRAEDLDAALAELGESLDIDREDLERLLHLIESHAEERRRLERTVLSAGD